MDRRFLKQKLHGLRHIIKADYEGGLTAKEIAHMYETTEKTVRKTLKEAGITLKRGRPAHRRHTTE